MDASPIAQAAGAAPGLAVPGAVPGAVSGALTGRTAAATGPGLAGGFAATLLKATDAAASTMPGPEAGPSPGEAAPPQGATAIAPPTTQPAIRQPGPPTAPPTVVLADGALVATRTDGLQATAALATSDPAALPEDLFPVAVPEPVPSGLAGSQPAHPEAASEADAGPGPGPAAEASGSLPQAATLVAATPVGGVAATPPTLPTPVVAQPAPLQGGAGASVETVPAARGTPGRTGLGPGNAAGTAAATLDATPAEDQARHPLPVAGEAPGLRDAVAWEGGKPLADPPPTADPQPRPPPATAGQDHASPPAEFQATPPPPGGGVAGAGGLIAPGEAAAGTAAPQPPPQPTRQPGPAPVRQLAPIAIALATGPARSPRLTVALEPEELGRVEIRIERGKDSEAATVHVLAERPETLALLQRDARELDRALQQAGVKLAEGGTSFGLGGQDRPAQEEAGARRPPSRGQPAPPLAMAAARPAGLVLSLLDIAV